VIKRFLQGIAIAFFMTGALLASEILIAMRREYLPTEPAMELSGTFGSRGGRSLRFVVLGDSTAAGLGASSPDHAYPTVLARRLASLGYQVELLALGVSGARAATVLSDQVPRALAADPDLVFVGVGANDAIHITPLRDVRRSMAEVIMQLKQSGAAVVVAGAPDMRAAAWLQPLRGLAGWRGRRVASAVRSTAEAAGIPVVPLAELAGPYFAGKPEGAYGGDDFHPGDGGYRAWADAIWPYVEYEVARRATFG
jgi:lysophospholipase L1-like esterase